MATMPEVNINLAVESVVSKVMLDFAQKIYDEHLLRIHDISFKWSDDEQIATSIILTVEKDLIPAGKVH